MGAIELIKSDLFRYAGTTSSKSFIKTYVKEAGFRFSVAFRLVNDGGVLKLFGIILWKLRNHQQIQILRKTKIGYSDLVSEVQRERVLPEVVLTGFCDFDDLIQNATEPSAVDESFIRCHGRLGHLGDCEWRERADHRVH